MEKSDTSRVVFSQKENKKSPLSPLQSSWCQAGPGLYRSTRLNMAYPNAIFTACAFLGFVMYSIPLPWHLRARNTGTCRSMVWIGLSCLNKFVNSIVWNSDAINWAPVWCDICKLSQTHHFGNRDLIGLSSVEVHNRELCSDTAILSLHQSWTLYRIPSMWSVIRTDADKRRDIMIDLVYRYRDSIYRDDDPRYAVII